MEAGAFQLPALDVYKRQIVNRANLRTRNLERGSMKQISDNQQGISLKKDVYKRQVSQQVDPEWAMPPESGNAFLDLVNRTGGRERMDLPSIFREPRPGPCLQLLSLIHI